MEMMYNVIVEKATSKTDASGRVLRVQGDGASISECNKASKPDSTNKLVIEQ